MNRRELFQSAAAVAVAAMIPASAPASDGGFGLIATAPTGPAFKLDFINKAYWLNGVRYSRLEDMPGMKLELGGNCRMTDRGLYVSGGRNLCS